MAEQLDQKTREVYARLWRYVTPHKLIGLDRNVVGMATTALIEGGLVLLLEPLMDEALVAQNLQTAKVAADYAFVTIFILRGIAGFATEASLGWIGRSVISSLRRAGLPKVPGAADALSSIASRRGPCCPA